MDGPYIQMDISALSFGIVIGIARVPVVLPKAYVGGYPKEAGSRVKRRFSK